MARDEKLFWVFYGGKNDILFLKGLKIDLCPLYTIDTQRAAQSAFSLDYSCTLKELLTRLKCQFALLHVAGNDATYTLKALLLLASLASMSCSESPFFNLRRNHESPTILRMAGAAKRPGENGHTTTKQENYFDGERERKRSRREERKRKSDTNDQSGTDEGGPSVVSTVSETKD